jgi:hypothetical protein
MDWDLLFVVTNAVAVAGWLALALLPRAERVLGAVLVAAIGLLCAIYLAMFVGLMGGMVDPGREGVGAPPFEYTVDGLKTAFVARGAIVLGWTHYLAFDLFVGLWIARDADKRRVGRIMQLPFLLATFLAGPIGLLAWLVARVRLTRR